LKVQKIGDLNPMTQDDSRTAGPSELHDLADRAKVKAVVRHSIAQSLAAHFPPPEDLPPELRELVERLDKI
jgi:hypothetical protein